MNLVEDLQLRIACEDSAMGPTLVDEGAPVARCLGRVVETTTELAEFAQGL
jgi:hypothetical protein